MVYVYLEFRKLTEKLRNRRRFGSTAKMHSRPTVLANGISHYSMLCAPSLWDLRAFKRAWPFVSPAYIAQRILRIFMTRTKSHRDINAKRELYYSSKCLNNQHEINELCGILNGRKVPATKKTRWTVHCPIPYDGQLGGMMTSRVFPSIC